MAAAREIFFPVHIPKCGGTTLQRIPKRNLGRGFWRDPRPAEPELYTASEWQEMLDARPALCCVSSHNLSLDLPYEYRGGQVIALTFVRDPVRRFLSHYFYRRTTNLKTPMQAVREMRLEDYTQHALAEGRQRANINGQTLYLNAKRNDESLDTIKTHLYAGRLLFWPLERFEEACVVLENMYPDTIRNCSYVQNNVSNRDQEVSDAVRATIAEHNKLDAELHQRAHAFLDECIEEVFADEEEKRALEKLRNRRLTKLKMRA